MIDVLGPSVDLYLNDRAVPLTDPSTGRVVNGGEAGQLRLYAGVQEITLPGTGAVSLSIKTSYAIRLKPMPRPAFPVISGHDAIANPLAVDWSDTNAIPAHTVRILNAVTPEEAQWVQMVKQMRAGRFPDGSGPAQHTLPQVPDARAVTVFGSLSHVSTDAMIGSITVGGEQTWVAKGDSFTADSSSGLPAGDDALVLLPALGGIAPESLLQGAAKVWVDHAGNDQLSSAWEWLSGRTVTTFRPVKLAASFVAVVALTLLVERGIVRITRRRQPNARD